jgi:hypothetical protein
MNRFIWSKERADIINITAMKEVVCVPIPPSGRSAMASSIAVASQDVGALPNMQLKLKTSRALPAPRTTASQPLSLSHRRSLLINRYQSYLSPG